MRPQEFGSAGDEFHELYAGTGRVNAVPEGAPVAPYEMLCGLLVPLYAGRAAEEAYYGRRAVTLSTAKEVRLLGFGLRPPSQSHFLSGSAACSTRTSTAACNGSTVHSCRAPTACDGPADICCASL